MKRVLMRCAILASLALPVALYAGDLEPLPWLGLSFTWSETAAHQHMLHVRAVTVAGPAARAGVRAGDLIAKINGERVDFGDELEFLLFLKDRKPGERLRLSVVREGRELPIIVTLGRLAEEARPKWERNLEMARSKRAENAARTQTHRP
jgi:C-terminal processing protease CtpA/Prc